MRVCGGLNVKKLGLGMAAMLVGATMVATPALAQSGGSEREDLLIAIQQGNSGDVNDLVAKGGKGWLDYTGHSGETPLTTAIKSRNTLFARYLIQEEANPDLANADGDTPLTLAVFRNESEVIDALLQAGADIDKGNRFGETPLILAVQARRTAIVRLLLDRGADPDVRDHRAGFSAREYAARDDRNRSFIRLIEQQKKKK